ncbi:Spy/CpxP family protein refolding chaperone [Legionella erythra]|uniref:16 kD immunogenic protein n=1 Tax=Legionella erythra TaxID=448 RepID=A0A0W0TQV7_LEGER|nr:Spy/CpxP family protein refolding chaperone [Legionella erythra]KTC97981.1 16 kD immunogenic protein [Legionella erythra]
MDSTRIHLKIKAEILVDTRYNAKRNNNKLEGFTMFKKLLIAIIACVSFLSLQIASADQAGNCPCKGRLSEMFKDLQLDANQQAQIKAIKDKNKEAMQASWKQMKELRGQLKALVTSDKLDEATLDKLVSQKAALMSSITKAKISTKNQIYNVLNDKQKQQFQSMMKQWEAKRMMHRQQCKGA